MFNNKEKSKIAYFCSRGNLVGERVELAFCLVFLVGESFVCELGFKIENIYQNGFARVRN